MSTDNSTNNVPVEDEDPVRLSGAKLIDEEMDITPMIDITFLLLIFFLVASKMTDEKAINLPTARNGDAVASKNAIILTMERGAGERAKVMDINGKPFAADVEQQAAEIADYVQKGFDEGKTTVIIRAEGPTRFGEVERVRKAISEVMEEGQPINLAIMQGN